MNDNFLTKRSYQIVILAIYYPYAIVLVYMI